jgi:hypothetical protein
MSAAPAGVRDSAVTVRGWPARLSAADRAALAYWAAAHVAVLVMAWAAAWEFRPGRTHAPLLGGFSNWDVAWYENIAAHGYFSPASKPDSAAFFPGYPAVLAAAHLVVRDWSLAGVLVSAVAGCFAVVSLSRLGGSRAVLALLVMPAAVFLATGYSEALFLALAIPAWLAATRGHTGRAALLAGLAGLVRPDGVFLTLALAVMAATGPRGQRARNAAVTLTGLAGPAAYEVYLRACTGSWTAWQAAQRAGWDMHLAWPWQTWKTTWWAAFGHPFAGSYSWEFQLEIAAFAAALAATVVFGVLRRWPEAVYCGLAVIAVGTQTWYEAVPRTLLLLFPVAAGTAALAARYRWLAYVLLPACVPAAVILGVAYLSGQWAG